MEPIDLTRDAVVFIHVPKAGGTTLAAALAQAVGPERTLRLRQGKIENWRYSRADERLSDLISAFRGAVGRARGRHPLAPTIRSAADLAEIDFLYGHFRIGQEPELPRRKRYISVLRHPVDRFLSRYYYTFDRDGRGDGREDKPSHDPKTGLPPESAEAFLEMMLERGTLNWRNGQCRFFAPSGRAAEARRVISAQDVMIAPLEALPALVAELDAAMPQTVSLPPNRNVGAKRAAQGPAPLDPAFRTRLEQVFAEDLALYQAACDAFAAGGAAALARPAAPAPSL